MKILLQLKNNMHNTSNNIYLQGKTYSKACYQYNEESSLDIVHVPSMPCHQYSIKNYTVQVIILYFRNLFENKDLFIEFVNNLIRCISKIRRDNLQEDIIIL